MSNTPNYGWDTPDNTGLVRNGALDMRTLGNAIDTSVWNVGFGQAGKNKVINGDFGIWQRGTSFTNPSFSADRFQSSATNTGATVTRENFTLGTAPVAGYESQYFWRLTQTSAGIDPRLFTNLEDVRLFAGQTMTFSFWAKSNVASAISRVEVRQNFGSGGSAQVDTVLAAVGTVSVTSNWVRYTYTAAIPSVTGKTIGAGSFFRLSIFGPASTAFVLDLWGLQAEAGNRATPFQTASGGSIQGELAMCQRYYWRQYATGAAGSFANGLVTSTAFGYFNLQNPVPMRIAPTSLDFSTIRMFDSVSEYAITPAIDRSGVITSFMNFNGSGFTANRPAMILSTNANSYIGLSAEL